MPGPRPKLATKKPEPKPDPRLLAEIPRSLTRRVRLYRVQLVGVERLTLQEYDARKGARGGVDWLPTRAAVVLRPEDVPALIEALQDAVQPEPELTPAA